MKALAGGRGRCPRILGYLLTVVVFSILLMMPASAAVNPAPPAGPEQIEPITPLLPDSPLDNVAGGAGTEDPNISININGESSDALNIVLLLTILTVLPSLLIMMTCFTRLVIVFSLLRNALGLQQTPPNQVLIGLALFLSLFIMRPVLTDINQNAYQPFSEGEIQGEEFIARASVPLREFMMKQTNPRDTNMFLTLADMEMPEQIEEYPMTVVVPAFITSEIKRAFTIGFLLFIPFLIIDMVVASALMSMGMMMLPPVTVSLPFKLLLFVLADGWGLLIKTLVQTYQF